MKEINEIPSGFPVDAIKNVEMKPDAGAFEQDLKMLAGGNEFNEDEKKEISDLLKTPEGLHILNDLEDPIVSVKKGKISGEYIFETGTGIEFSFLASHSNKRHS